MTKIGIINCITCHIRYGITPGLHIVLRYNRTKKTTLPGRGVTLSRYDGTQTGVYLGAGADETESIRPVDRTRLPHNWTSGNHLDA